MNLQPLAIAKAVALAFVAGIVLGAAAGLGLGLFGPFFVDENGDSLILSVVVFSIGALPSPLCGFLAAYFAQARPYLHSALSGFVYLVVLLSFLIWPGQEPFSWTDALHYVLVIPLALLGGWILQSQTK